MFGLVLAIGIVVDDAIVVVENVERNLEQGLSPREAAHRSMDEVSTRLGRDRPGPLRGLRARHLPDRHHGRILSPVRGHDRGIDDHLAASVADPVAGACRPAAAAEERASRRNRRHGLRPSGRRLVQQVLRSPEQMVRQLHASAAQRPEARADDLRRPRRPDAWRLLVHAERLHPGAGPGLCARRHPASARKLDRTHGRGAQEGGRPAAESPGRRRGGDVLRLRRSVGDAGIQRRRRLCHLQAVRGTRGNRSHRTQHRERHARGARRPGRSLRVRHPAARHPGRRQRRRLPHDRPGPAGRRLPGARAGRASN